jgi:hypothetical protein
VESSAISAVVPGLRKEREGRIHSVADATGSKSLGHSANEVKTIAGIAFFIIRPSVANFAKSQSFAYSC